jgi:glycosyltransferase involved in cell wall biosynthesis
VFIDCGVTAPVYVAPLGIGDVYQPAVRHRKPGDPFTFLAFVDRGVRKGWHHAIQAFVKAFGDNPNYRLILKARTSEGPPIGITNPNIKFIQQDMTEQELYELYLSADVLVNANLGEGFGLIPREFAATGGLALATNWGGTAEGINEWGLPIAYKMIPAWGDKHHPRGLGMWADPDIEGLAVLMDVVAESRDRWQPKAYERASNLHKMYSWESFGRSVLFHWQSAAMRPARVMEYA